MADCSLIAFKKTGPGSALSAHVPTIVTPSLFARRTGQVTWSFMSIKTLYLVSSSLLHTCQDHGSFTVTHGGLLAARVQRLKCAVGDGGPGQGPSSWFKGMTWEWSRDVATPSSSSPSSLLSQLLPMCLGEGVEDLSPAPTVFSEGHFQVRGPPLSHTFRQSAKDIGCSLAQGGHDTGC